jgi:hypothetical protein
MGHVVADAAHDGAAHGALASRSHDDHGGFVFRRSLRQRLTRLSLRVERQPLAIYL